MLWPPQHEENSADGVARFSLRAAPLDRRLADADETARAGPARLILRVRATASMVGKGTRGRRPGEGAMGSPCV